MTPPKAVRHLTSEQFAERIGVSVETLQEWRRDGRGPRWIQDGAKFIRYRLADVEEWEESRLVVPGAA